MLKQPLLENLTRLRLPGFREGLREQWENPHYAELPFDERLGLLVDLECTRRDNSSLERRIKAARFGLPASIEDLDLSPVRGLDRSFILELAQGEWIRRHLNILVLGPTGAGKSYLACALGQAVSRRTLGRCADTASRCAITALLACCTRSCSPTPMDPFQSSWPAWPGCSC